MNTETAETTCPYVGWSGGCDDCTLGLEPMTCEEYLRDLGMEE